MPLARHVGKILRTSPGLNYGIRRALASVVGDEALSRLYFRMHHGRRLNLDAPSTFNEKVMWMKLRLRDPRLPALVDKWSVRSFVQSELGPDVLVAAVALVDKLDDLDLDRLPERFVIKPTHGSGWVSVCADRSRYDWEQEREKLARWLSQDYYFHAREWVYRRLPRRLLVEEFLDGGNGAPPRDYKFFCFDGEPRMVQVDSDRFGSHTRDLFDTSWKSLRVAYRYPVSATPPHRPEQLDQMLDVCRALSKTFAFVRVDLYGVSGRVLFGELTFFPENGIGVFSDPAFDAGLGELLRIPRD